jgi:predicted ATPase
MEGKLVIRALELRNFLSYGDELQKVERQTLNVLIGPNASGKSTFIESLAFRSG